MGATLPQDTVAESAITAAFYVQDGLNHKCPSANPLDLSQIEQSNPRGYYSPLCFFKSLPGLDPEHVFHHLRTSLEPTRQAIPSLACEIVPFDDGKKPTGKIALSPGTFGDLIRKDLRGTGLFYDELRKQNFPQSRLNPTDLCHRGVFPMVGEQQPVFVPQLNIIDGGFILAAQCHHSIFDAQGLTEVLRVWAQNCRHSQDDSIPKCDSLPIETFDRTAHIASHKPTANMGRPEHHPELIVSPEPITFGETAMKETHESRVYLLSPEALVQLKEDYVVVHPGRDEAVMRSLSTNDMVTALLWYAVYRAQNDPERFPDGTRLSHHIVNVDLRLRSTPALSRRYPGCPMSYARAAIPIRDLCEPSSIGSLAIEIRKAVDERTPEYVKSLVTLLDTVPGYDHVVSASYPNLMGSDCLTSTWYKLDIYDLDFGPAIGKIERVRFSKRGLFNGLSMIYPKVTKGEGKGMEVAVGLDQCNFEKLQKDPVWCRYAKPTDPGYDSI